jgi:hypothetical protein
MICSAISGNGRDADPGHRLARGDFGMADNLMKMSADVPKKRWLAGWLTAISALFLCLAQAPNAHADSASCLAKVSSFVVELDELLSKERNWITPYFDLTKRYFPVYDCEVDALLEMVRGSRFIRSISHHAGTNLYLITFSSDEVEVDFAYRASEKKSLAASAGFIHKL